MTDEIQELLSGLRLGRYENADDKIGLLSAALIEGAADAPLLLSLLRAPQLPLRLAAVDACRNRTEPELRAAIVELAQDSEVRVREKLAVTLTDRGDAETIDALRKLAGDSEADVRTAAMRGSSGKSELREIQEACLLKDASWHVRMAAANALDRHPGPEILRAIGLAMKQEDDYDIGRRCAEIIETRMEQFSESVLLPLVSEAGLLLQLDQKLKGFGDHRYPKFSAWLKSRTSVYVDSETLGKHGTNLTALAAGGDLAHAHFAEDAIESLLNLLRRPEPRSIALLGPAGTGKTALVQELAYRLSKTENGNWHVLRISPTDFMAGTRYLGEWETKVRDLVEIVRKPRRVLLYVPNFSDLAGAGTWSKSDASVATALAPYLDDGSVVMLGESSPEEFERGVGKLPSLSRLFEKVLLLEATTENTRNILRAIRDEEKSRISNEILDQILEVSSQFLSHVNRPGNACGLLRSVIKNERDFEPVPEFRNVLDTLSRSSGLPAPILDDSIVLVQQRVREFFESRILGQPAAIEAVADLITLIKAGLTDPNRPFGVFLFSGPTGVGKTELARALAEYIFGDANRLKRFDMSEFANQEGFTRLIGTPTENGILTDAVRQQPFSVVLLDEIEKGHLNVFDLCLQIFDAGRLTDGRGRTVDFRRTIIILTSNVGSNTGLLGFGGAGSGRAAEKGIPSKELSRFFRPEFLNRLDRIVQFRPISLEVAEQIARREIEAALKRTGIKRRQLILDVDAAVVSLLVREGYSQQFGARPLKRTVDRLLLLPLAKAIASGAVAPHSLVRLTERGGRIHAEVTPPASLSPESAVGESQRKPELKRIEELNASFERLREPVAALSRRKSELLEQVHQSAFYRDADHRASILDEIHNLEQFLTLHENAVRILRSLSEPASGMAPAQIVKRIESLEKEIAYLELVARCNDARDLRETFITISLVDRNGDVRESVEKLVAMYRALAERRRMTCEILGEFYAGVQDRVSLHIAGLGAHGLFKDEAGLHQFDFRRKEKSSRTRMETFQEDRETVRVEVSRGGNEFPRDFEKQVSIKTSVLKPPRKRLILADLKIALFHEPSVRSIELWTPGPKDQALAKALSLLRAQIESDPAGNGDGVVRRYELGIGARVRDMRNGRTSMLVGRILKGEIDPLQ